MASDEQQRSRGGTVTDAGGRGSHPDQVQPLPEGRITPQIKQTLAPEVNIQKRLDFSKQSTERDFEFWVTALIIDEEFGKTSYVYVENESEYVDEFEYDRNRKDQGIVLIFNQLCFKNHDNRPGSTKDVNNIVFTLGRLGYNIEEKYIFSNVSTQEIWDKIDKLSEEDLSNRNCLILFFLTHGDRQDLLHTTDGTIGSKDVWEKLANHKDLREKPKLFVFQACKGRGFSTAFEMQNAGQQHTLSYISLPFYPLPRDIIICYSSAEDTRAHRHVKKGSWLIQEICRNFLAYGRRDDVFSLLTRVTKCVSTYTHQNNKQMPVILSTLSKKFYMAKTRDRMNTLAVRKYNKDIHSVLLELHELVDCLDKVPCGKK